MQNFRTQSISLNQAWYEHAQGLIQHQAHPRRLNLFMDTSYGVVDLTLADGRQLSGVLVLDDDLLVPETIAPFTAEDIRAMTDTPAASIPDFTITDEASVHTGSGIEMGNLRRLCLFGPPERKDRDSGWRQKSIDEAWDEALDDDRRVSTFGGEIPAALHGPDSLVLTPAGIEMTLYPVGGTERITLTRRPQTIALWHELLSQTFAIAPDFTLGDLIELLDLPPDVDQFVYWRSNPRRLLNGFRPWVEALARPVRPRVVRARKYFTRDYAVRDDAPIFRGTDITVAEVTDALAQGDTVEQILARYPALAPDAVELLAAKETDWLEALLDEAWIEVRYCTNRWSPDDERERRAARVAHLGAVPDHAGKETVESGESGTPDDEGLPHRLAPTNVARYQVYYDVSLMGRPRYCDDGMTGARKGVRERYGLDFTNINEIAHLPLRYASATDFEVSHEETLAWSRGPRRAWVNGGEQGEPPARPVAFQTHMVITLGEFLGALFDDLRLPRPGDEDDEEDDA